MPPMQDVLAKYRPDLSIFDESNPLSLFNIAPECFIPLIRQVMEKNSKLMLYPDCILRSNCKPDERDDRLRLSFWDEYNLATTLGKRMTLPNVIHRICSFEVWKNYYERNTKKILWIITAPRDYNLALRQIHNHGMERLEEIMRLSIKNPEKPREVDYRAVALILKTFQLVDLRVKGAILQKVQIQQQSVNFNADVTQEQLQNLSELSVEQLEAMEKKLERLQRIEGKVLDLPPESRLDFLEAEVKCKDVKDDATLKQFKDDELSLLNKVEEQNGRS